MLNHKFFAIAAIASSLLVQTGVIADETSTSSQKVTTPAGTAERKSERSTSAAGSSTKVESSHSNAAGSESKKYKAEVGPHGAKVSATKTAAGVNADGSVSTSKQHESHAVGDAGSVHKKSSTNTTTTPDGSTSTEKHEATKTTH